MSSSSYQSIKPNDPDVDPPPSQSDSSSLPISPMFKRKRILIIATTVASILSLILLASAISRTIQYAPSRAHSSAMLQASHSIKKLSKKKVSNSVPFGCDVTVFLVRHCEKESLKHDCSRIGMEHAKFFTTQFGDDEERWPAPDRLYARAPDGGVMRSIQSLEPIAEKFNLPIIEKFGVQNRKELSNELFTDMSSGELCGKLVVVNWKHENIPKVAQDLGCGPMEGCSFEIDAWDYNFVWSLHYTYDLPYASSRHSGKVGKKAGWTLQGQVLDQYWDLTAWEKKMGEEKTLNDHLT